MMMTSAPTVFSLPFSVSARSLAGGVATRLVVWVGLSLAESFSKDVEGTMASVWKNVSRPP